MKFRVGDILLVSRFYNAFMLKKDSCLARRIFREYVNLNLHFILHITRVSSSEGALQSLQQKNFDLIITMNCIAYLNPIEFGQEIKDIDLKKTVVCWRTIILILSGD